jgi:hypothetical protein
MQEDNSFTAPCLSPGLYGIASSHSPPWGTQVSCMNMKSISVSVLLCFNINVILQWNMVRQKEMQCVTGMRVSKSFHWPLYELSHFLCSQVLAVGPDIYWKQNKNIGLTAQLTPKRERKRKKNTGGDRESQVLNCAFQLETQDNVNLHKLL